MPINLENLVKALRQEPWAEGISVDKDFWTLLTKWMEKHALSEFLDQVTRQVDEIVEIDPDLSEPQILEMATLYMVDFLGAHSASVRIYDPQAEQMLSYGSYPCKEDARESFIPLEGSIAGEVVKTRRPFLVPDILAEERYHNKEVINGMGVNSLMAIPLEIPRFYPRERDTVGVIQIYFAERARAFSALEVQLADLMAKRLSFVIARKKILSMQRTNEKKEAIVRHIFRTLGTRSGIKMKEVFDRVIPELADMVNLQSSALFSVTDDLNNVVLEAGYPESGYHSIGKSFPVGSEPVFELILKLRDDSLNSDFDIVTPSYILVVNPQRSDLISNNLKKFVALHNVNSILLIPLEVDGETTHFMTFDALDHRLRYRDDEIEIFLFLGRELMKAQKMERMDDILHDFRNPAIATAGFARRLKRLLGEKGLERSQDQIRKYVDILLDETSRLQELALSIYHVGEDQMVDLTSVLLKRFEINKEAIREQLKQNVDLKEGPFDNDLRVRCYPLHLERVFDNLLNNATKAIPIKGGILSIQTYADGEWACVEISNTGRISDEDRLRILEGQGRGRGLYITNRIIRSFKGKIEVRGEKTSTTFVVRLPLYKDT
ncbi:MAG: GAF domain-containing sensor histidine kinase [Thermodesulfobacteriota bacterium]|nr:GAF domain-containing sensor histidine kinase [Thermodesulfobacteriota bacterium]